MKTAFKIFILRKRIKAVVVELSAGNA